MPDKRNTLDPVAAWLTLPARLRTLLRGKSKADLDRRAPERMTLRETVHHVAEANLVASNMILAALATDGGNFDWTWVMPGAAWTKRLGYDKLDVKTSLEALSGVTRHIAALVAAQPGALKRTVKLNDRPGAKRYAMTVEAIIRQEVRHAEEHLEDVRDGLLARKGRRAPR